MKRIIALLAALILSFTAICLPAGAATASEQEDQNISMPFFDNMKTVFEFIGNGLNDMTVYLVPVDGTVSEFHIKFTQNDGTVQDLPIYNFYDSKTGEVFGFNRDQGVFDSGFAYNAQSKTFYATNGCWQRQFGFTPLYDIAAKAVGFDYATRRIFFKYDGKEWMIQVWKGNYAFDLLIGGEVGIYNRPEGTVNGLFFNCVPDEEMMPVSMMVYDNSRMYINRLSQLTWWMTGFVLSEEHVNPYTLTLETEIEFPNQEMCDAFAKGARIYTDITCHTDGKTASIKW